MRARPKSPHPLLIVLTLIAGWIAFPALADSAPAVAAHDDGSRYTRGLLWRIESPGRPPSHLFGTIHSSDPRVVSLPAPVKQAFDRSGSFTMEMVTDGSALVAMAETMFLGEGQTLRQITGDALYGEIREALAARGLPEQGLEKQKPWVVLMTLSAPPNRGGMFLDLSLQLQATLAGKPVHGLESMQEQLAVFDELATEDQVTLLRETVKAQREAEAQLEALTRAWLARDLGQLMATVEKYRPEDARLYNTLMQRLLDDRNRRMAERMEARLAEGNAFIAVGAAHLPGPDGLLALLARRGYRLTAVY
ncbi:polysaccharide biosynthesis protein GumN [Sulfurifustis variabilis]|uniref:Polysaccharide biosynthesis protein GumN n=1 Tax=Sulfurifustis variabilis TaxID=1675686 RepID=A0A1B4V2T3_9GAMM|nr:TraB/GumN family protein [Sulfurifustis variabilis]BAU47856.1 polysaccharide biosynthesis protein GumN [Sulfurifustis variabilis]